MKKLNIDVLVGQTIKKISFKGESDIIEVYFEMDNGISYKMYHEQDCCEVVYLEDCCGDWDDIVGSPIVFAEAISSEDKSPATEDFGQWTFYKIDTRLGGITLRWYGHSNGYYAVNVDFSLK